MAENKSSLIRDDDMPKSITSKRLNGLNYLAQAHAVKVYLRGKKKLKHLTYPQPDVKASNYEDWMSEDSIVMGWLWNLTLQIGRAHV